jgi:hypothetical protein
MQNASKARKSSYKSMRVLILQHKLLLCFTQLPKTTTINMTTVTEIRTPNAPAPLPVFSQAIKANGMIFCSGNIGLDKDTWKLVEGGIKAQTVYFTSLIFFFF